MPILTIERLGDIKPDAVGSVADALVLCVDGVAVENQVSTTYECEGHDHIPTFTVKFAMLSDVTLGKGSPILKLCPININSFDNAGDERQNLFQIPMDMDDGSTTVDL